MVLSESIFEISVLTADDDSLVAAAIAAEVARQSIRALGSSANLVSVNQACSKIYRARCGKIQVSPVQLACGTRERINGRGAYTKRGSVKT